MVVFCLKEALIIRYGSPRRRMKLFLQHGYAPSMSSSRRGKFSWKLFVTCFHAVIHRPRCNHCAKRSQERILHAWNNMFVQWFTHRPWRNHSVKLFSGKLRLHWRWPVQIHLIIEAYPLKLTLSYKIIFPTIDCVS